MGKFWDAVKRGVEAAGESMSEGRKPHRYSVLDKLVRCPHCGNEEFLKARDVQLDRNVLAQVEWFNERVSVLACVECGRLEWFALEPERH